MTTEHFRMTDYKPHDTRVAYRVLRRHLGGLSNAMALK